MSFIAASSPISETGTATQEHKTVDEKDLDVAAQLAIDGDATGKSINPEEAVRLKRKIDKHLMPLMCLLYLMTFADKTTLGQSAVLGIIPGAKLTQNDFNWLGTVFYLSYLAFQYPQNLALQYLPVGKWMSINILIWAIALCAQSACHSFQTLLGCRLVMGACEGAITPGRVIGVRIHLHVRSMVLTILCNEVGFNGIAIIILGFIAFGTLHTHTHNFMPWQWLVASPFPAADMLKNVT
ncbi:hypothetical protein HWV62_8423 [Athelia sp. TMB]|nr:hypothetical protein HWV62_8423 [Athelia sp. TMB]